MASQTETEKRPLQVTVLNCWEFMGCDRGPEAGESPTQHRCPAAWCRPADGINRGRNGGRYCWKVAGTSCRQGLYCSNVDTEGGCFYCQFFRLVRNEEAGDFVL